MAAEQRDWIHGATIDRRTKALRFASVSSLDLGDHAAGGCKRKWHYRYVQKIRQESDEKQVRGQDGHACIAAFLTDGNKAVSADVARGMHMVPKPGPDLLVEWDLLRRPGVAYPEPLTYVHSPALLAAAPLKIDGVPLLGNIDLAHARGDNVGAEDHEPTRDPDGTVEVCDWKFVGGDKFMKKPGELHEVTQLAGYAEWVWQVRPDTPLVRLSLGYFPQRGRPRKVSRLVRREDVRPTLDHLVGVVRGIGEVAREADVERVDANTDACGSYGGCPHLEYCSAPKRKTLESLVGITTAASLVVPAPQPGGIVPVASLLSRSTGGIQSAVTAAPAAAPDPAAVAAERARIAVEERTARLKALVPAGFAQACEAVRAFGRGFPKLTGKAATAYYAMGGQEMAAGAAVDGTGEISYVELDDPSLVGKLAEDLAEDAKRSGTAPAVSPLPPDAPASDPRLAAEGGVPTNTTNTAPIQTPPNVVPMTQTPDPVKAEPEQPKKKTRAKKEPEAEADGQSPALHIYVDCATTHPTTSLNDWAQEIADKIAAKFGAVDIRCCAEDSAGGYDKWKGLVMAFVRDEKAAPLPGGHYSLETRFSALMAVVAEGLQLRAKLSGGSYQRGIR